MHTQILCRFATSLFVLSSIATRISARTFNATPPYRALMLTSVNENVTRVTAQNGPINLFDNNLLYDVLPYLQSLVPSTNSSGSSQNAPKVVIFDSLNPDYWLMHRDVQGIIPPLAQWKLDSISTYIAITRYLQNITSTIFIAEINGCAYGAGNEISVQMDMRFAGPNASVGFFESGVGVFPGGGGIQFLADLVGKARTLEYSLGTLEIDGKHGAEIGWFNEYYADAAQLTQSVEDLARRIALYPQGVINATKAGLAWRNAPIEVLEGDIAEFIRLDMMADRAPLEQRMLNVTNNETNGFELSVPANAPLLYGAEYVDLVPRGKAGGV